MLRRRRVYQLSREPRGGSRLLNHAAERTFVRDARGSPGGEACALRKPLALNATQSAEMLRVCEQQGVLLMTEGPRQYRRAAWARSQSHTESEARARGPRKLARFFDESEGFLLFENHGFAVTPRRGNVPAPDLCLPLRRFRHDSAD